MDLGSMHRSTKSGLQSPLKLFICRCGKTTETKQSPTKAFSFSPPQTLPVFNFHIPIDFSGYVYSFSTEEFQGSERTLCDTITTDLCP